MEKICSIVAGGKKSLINIEKGSFVIACDKGYKYCRKAKTNPNVVIGDFDSFKGKIIGKSQVISLPTEKDDTDLMAAIKYAVKENFSVVNLYCALGNRLDHMLGNIQASMYAAKNGLTVNIYDKKNELHIISNSSIEISKKSNYSISVLSLTDKCENVSISGAKYNLKNSMLVNSEPIGISNEWVDDMRIEAGNGILLIIISKLK